MNADGTNRRRVAPFGAPFWSPDGKRLLINSIFEPITSDVFDLATQRTTRINIPGRRIFSWPRWAGPNTLVACIGTGTEPDSIVLLDISQPMESRVVETLWRRSAEQDLYARWPLYLPSTGTCYFVGVEGNRRTLLSIQRGEHGTASAVEGGGHEDELGGLSFSPDGRYLLFGANRPESRGRTGHGIDLEHRREGGSAAGRGHPRTPARVQQGSGHADAGLPAGPGRRKHFARGR